MLKIIYGMEQAESILGPVQIIYFPSALFDARRKEEWFQDSFVQKILHDVDNVEVVAGEAVRRLDFPRTFSVEKLSGGSKCLITLYKIRDKIQCITMGDNCVDLLEQIASFYEQDGKDLVIISNSFTYFNFKYIDYIRVLNWGGIDCYSRDDMREKILYRFLDQEVPREDNELTEKEIEAMNSYFESLDGGKRDV